MKKDTLPVYVSMIWRARFPSTGRTRMLASRTSALPGIPLLLASHPADFLVLVHQLVFARTPGGNHLVQLFGRGAHGIEFGFSATLLRRDVETERFTVSGDRERSTRFEIVRELFAELAHADLYGFHYCVPTVHNSILRHSKGTVESGINRIVTLGGSAGVDLAKIGIPSGALAS